MNYLRTLVPSLRALALALLTLPVVGSAFATTVSTENPDDPPGRVGRVADVQGQAWIYHPAEGDWTGAERNRPLTTGDRLATESGGRAEVRIGSTTLRLDGASEVEVLRLDDERMVLQLHSGSLAARLRSRETVPEFELRTGEGRFTVQRTGRYRFDRADEASHVTVYTGQALYEGQGSALTVNAGQRAEFWIDGNNTAQYSIVEPARDSFASWNAERDRAEERSAATRYVSPEMTGVEDLDRYGNWEQDAEYGTLWVPRAVAPGWAPYSAGRWAWVAPWGWTWVDQAPWGFAPFHYGRWVWASSRWCWSPGHYVRRPVYAPALVAWIAGPALSVGVSTGPAIGWLPLAPREVYVPSYRVSPGYVRNVNITHVVNITNITTIVNNPQQAVGGRDFSNRKFPHAVTVVPASTLTTRAPVAPAARPWRDAPAQRDVERRPLRDAVVAAPPAELVAPPRATPDKGVPRTLLPVLRRDSPRERVDTGAGRPAPAVPPAQRPSRDERDARETPREAPRDAPRDARETARDARESPRDLRETPRDGREAGRDARETPRREVPREGPRDDPRDEAQTRERPRPAPPRQGGPAPAPLPAPVTMPPREERKPAAPPAQRERPDPRPPTTAPAPSREPREAHEPVRPREPREDRREERRDRPAAAPPIMQPPRAVAPAAPAAPVVREPRQPSQEPPGRRQAEPRGPENRPSIGEGRGAAGRRHAD